MTIEPCTKRLEDFKQIATWENQPEILPFLTPNLKEGEHPLVDPYQLYKHSEHRHLFYIVADDGQRIGFVDYMDHPGHLYDKTVRSAWPSICIGERHYWGKGYAKRALKALEAIIWQEGFERIEIGVFGYNTRAKQLYESLGYQFCHVSSNFTFYRNEWHNDFRLEKYRPIDESES